MMMTTDQPLPRPGSTLFLAIQGPAVEEVEALKRIALQTGLRATLIVLNEDRTRQPERIELGPQPMHLPGLWAMLEDATEQEAIRSRVVSSVHGLLASLDYMQQLEMEAMLYGSQLPKLPLEIKALEAFAIPEKKRVQKQGKKGRGFADPRSRIIT